MASSNDVLSLTQMLGSKSEAEALSECCKANSKGYNPLMVAAQQGNNEVLILLIAHLLKIAESDNGTLHHSMVGKMPLSGSFDG